ncbi:MAG: ubiquinone/menaquinone biosynthesis methyltransferase [Bacteroidota bacterium]
MSEEIRNMFAGISDSYDRLNDILSLGIHKKWKKLAVETAMKDKGRQGSYLDCASGTGDLALLLKAFSSGNAKVTALDFTAEMLRIAGERADALSFDIEMILADVLQMPLRDNSYDAALIAYGIRNTDSTVKCLEEMARVVRKGGRVVILEFGKPKFPMSLPYGLYARVVMPLVGKAVSGSSNAYSYLPESSMKYPCGSDFLNIMDYTKKFISTEYRTLSGGISYLYTGIVK